MAVSDLSLVTRSLSRLIEFNVETLTGAAPQVTSVPPETLENQNENLNLYLFHIAENPSRRAEPARGRAPAPIATTPMAVQLFYIITAQHQTASVHDTEVEQRLLGAAMKTLHDFPVIDDRSRAGPLASLVFEPGLRNAGNRLQTVLRPISPEEAVSFWTAEQARTVRLSLYCEVSWIFLEPEEPTSRPGLVLSIGDYVSQLAAITLDRSRSTLAFTPPAESGLGPQTRSVEPGRPSVEPSAAPVDSGLFELLGSNLAAGQRSRLVLRTARWWRLDPPVREIPVDLAQDAAQGWEVDFAPTRVRVRVGQRLTYEPEEGPPVAVDVFPGVYLVAVETSVGVRSNGLPPTDLRERSNFVPVLFAPRITANSAPDPAQNQRITIDLAPGFDITHGGVNDAERLDVALTVDGVAYRRVDGFSADGNDQGRFVVSFTSVPLRSSIVFEPAFDATVPGVHPTRVAVEGVDAQPWWIEIP